MKSSIKYITKKIEECIEEFLFEEEMANLRPVTTGLSRTIYVSSKNSNHGPRIKVANTTSIKFNPHDTFSVLINELTVVGTPNINKRELDKIYNFIKINKAPLLKLWNDDIDVAQFLKLLNKVKK